jgi:glycosyltransferase involved in cell wall biosynthesis
MIGANLAGVTGDSNVIKNLIKVLAKTECIRLIPFLPVFHKGNFFPEENYHLIAKKVTPKIFFYCLKNSIRWLKVIFPYLKFSLRGYAYYFITLFYRGLIEQEINKERPDIIHLHAISIEAVPFIEAALWNRVPLVVTLHGLYSLDPSINLYFKKKLEGDLLNNLSENDVAITAVSTYTQRQVIDVFNIKEKGIVKIFNGVDFENFFLFKDKNELRNYYKIMTKKIVILQVGSINQRKNHIAFLEALAEMDNVHKDNILYLIVGDGPEKKNLLKFSEKQGLQQNVRFTGSVSQKMLIDLYHLSDFFILPSKSEGLPLVFLEAFAAGIPIITFADIQGVSDIYQSFCMELIPNRSKSSIINSLIISMNREWNHKKISEYAKQFDWQSVCIEYKKVYETAIQQHLQLSTAE